MADNNARDGLEKVISGGQTGVDRAALDAARAAGVPADGWCPRGRRAEDGVIDARYPLQETETAAYSERTRLNVRDSDATLIIGAPSRSGGTQLTAQEAARLRKPLLHCEADVSANRVEEVVDWLRRHHVRVLNIAGPRASEAPGIYERAFELVSAILSAAR